jgi:mono/diheme cytochrome c family protein
LADEDKPTAQAYLKWVEHAIQQYQKNPSVETRKARARQVFELSTAAVAATLTLCLDSVQESLNNRAVAERELNEARQIWAAFEHEVKHSDPPAFARLGEAWLEATSGMGSAGVMGVGAVPIAEAKVKSSAQRIAVYVIDNFAQYKAAEPPRLAPLPTASPTFNPNAQVPIKLPPGTNLNKQIPRPRQILGMAARGADESKTPLIAIGDMAFDSAYIFGEPARSLGITCNVCHNKGVTNPQFFIPGLSGRPGGMDVSNSFFEPQANNGHFGHLDTPDLRGIRATAPYGRNGRTASLREFVRNVIVLEFNGPEPDPMIVDGMVAYMNEFEFLPNPYLNPDGTLTAKASAAAKRGEKIFNAPFKGMGNRSCATCHIPSDAFLDRKRHDIGTTGGFAPHSLDRALDTPTLLNAKYTAPYFHDGSQPTLRAVNEWFNKRFKLNLTKQQIDDLTAYVETIGEGVDAYEDSPYYLDAEMQEFGFFLSAYEFMKSQGKWNLINVTFQTVASEIRNHKWELQDDSHRPIMERLADILDEAYDAVGRKEYDLVDKKVAEYRKLYEENVEKLK